MTVLKVYDESRSAWSSSVRLPVTITVPSDGTDQTAFIAAQFAAVSNGDSATDRQLVTIRNADPVAGSRVDGTITLTGRHNLIIQAPPNETFYIWTDLTGIQAGVTNAHGDSSRAHFRTTSGASDITFRRLKVRGPNTGRNASDPRFADYTASVAFEHAFNADNNSARIVWEDCESVNIYGDVIAIGGSGDNTQAIDITYRRITGAFNGRQGISIVNALGVLIEDFSILGCGRAGLDVEPIETSPPQFVGDITLRNGSLSSSLYTWQIVGTGSGPDYRGDFTLEDVTTVAAASSSREPHFNGGGGNFTLRRMTHLVATGGAQALNISAGWDGDVLIEDCNLSSAASGVCIKGGSGVTGTLTVRGTDFGKATTFEETPGVVDVRCGNVWANGAQNDGVCP